MFLSVLEIHPPDKLSLYVDHSHTSYKVFISFNVDCFLDPLLRVFYFSYFGVHG